MTETRRLWELEQEQGVLSIPSVQAATILGRIYFANGMDKMGWRIWTDAVAMADKLNLFHVEPHLSEKDRISRTITAWGIFSQQAYELKIPTLDLTYIEPAANPISGSRAFTS